MLCPICNVDLVITEKRNIEIDYCPKCRGIWLDRGELDKFKKADEADRVYGISRDNDRDYDDDRHKYLHGKHRKKKSFFDDLFDF